MLVQLEDFVKKQEEELKEFTAEELWVADDIAQMALDCIDSASEKMIDSNPGEREMCVEFLALAAIDEAILHARANLGAKEGVESIRKLIESHLAQL